MRLTPEEVAAITTAARDAFGASTVVRLFGSRVHDHLRGGDIDLHFEVDPGRDTDAAVDRFEELVFRSMDEQRIDKVFTVRGRPRGPFEDIGYRDGVVLNAAPHPHPFAASPLVPSPTGRGARRASAAG